MDTLKAISPHPFQGPGLMQAPPKTDDVSAGSVTAATTVTVTAIPAKSPERNSQEDRQQISNAVEDINNFFQMTQRSLGFSIDEDSGHMVMQIKDTQTNELIRQIPGEDVLKLAKQLDDLTGVLFKAQA